MSDKSLPWIYQDMRIKSYDQYQQYVLSIYWIFTLVTTVGYGDFFGYTSLEFIITLVFMFCGFLVSSSIFWLMVQFLEKDYDFSACLS